MHNFLNLTYFTVAYILYVMVQPSSETLLVLLITTFSKIFRQSVVLIGVLLKVKGAYSCS